MNYSASLIKQYLHKPIYDPQHKRGRTQLKNPVGVSLARTSPHVNQTKLLRYPHNSTTRRNQNHTNPIYDPQYKRGGAPIKKTQQSKIQHP